MSQKVAINGFGRIGRLIFRDLWKKGINIVAINDLTPAKALAYLLEFDSSQGKFEANNISYTENSIIVNGKEIKVFSERDAKNIPWGKEGIDLVVESTGFYTSKDAAEAHIIAGAKKVVISAPAQGDLKTVVFGVNHLNLTKEDKIISAASCTTNSLAPVVKVLDEQFGIVKGLMTTVHAVTNDQKLLDVPHADLRRGRAAAWNIIPSSTGAAVAISLVLPNLKGKLDGAALRVPTITGSITDLTVELNKTGLTAKEINEVMEKTISADKDLARAISFNTKEIVSTDIIGSSFGAIFDATLTKVITDENGKQLVKVASWYDNEGSYVSQLGRVIEFFLGL